MEGSSMQDEQQSPVSPQKPADTKKERIMAVILLIIFSTSFGFAGGYFGDRASGDNRTQEISRQNISSESDLTANIAKEVGPSVVSVNVTSQGLRDTIFGSHQVQQQSAGTGIIISQDGTIITNRHVIPAGASSVGVILSDGTQFEDVEVIGRTNDNDALDVAFLKIKDKKGKNLKAAKIGDSSKVEVGQKVIAIGNALGQFQNSVTSGIISGYGRSVEAGNAQSTETLQNLFQTDASINQGNSGGPLVNINGEVIGINTAVASDAENLGFAIPINDVKGLVTSVLRDGKLVRPYLGVRYVTLTDEYAFQLDIETKRGAYVVAGSTGQPAIAQDSPAAKAGLRENDIITKIGNDAVDEKNSLISLLGRHSVGDKVKITIIRDGNQQTLETTLEATPES